MTNTGVKLDDDLLAHMALHHFPAEHQTTKPVIIANAESSNVALTVNGVLSQINKLICDGDTKTITTPLALNTRPRPNYNDIQQNYQRCLNGIHNTKTFHSAENCWQLHPERNPNMTGRSGLANTASSTGSAVCTKAVNGNWSGKPILDTGTTQSMSKSQAKFA